MRNKRDKENNGEIIVKNDDIMCGYFNVLPQPKVSCKVFSLQIRH